MQKEKKEFQSLYSYTLNLNNLFKHKDSKVFRFRMYILFFHFHQCYSVQYFFNYPQNKKKKNEIPNPINLVERLNKPFSPRTLFLNVWEDVWSLIRSFRICLHMMAGSSIRPFVHSNICMGT